MWPLRLVVLFLHGLARKLSVMTDFCTSAIKGRVVRETS